jgi:response regulator RpfG family c-di-GMP phosphodiesterase
LQCRKEGVSRLRLLVVDDDPGLLELIRTTFEDVEVDVDEATTSASARALVASDPPDVMVLDVRLAGESGLDLCRELKADLRTGAIPIVLLSGLVDLEPRVAADAGADAYLPKPFSPLQLLGLVERLAGGLGSYALTEVPLDRSDNAQLMLYARDLRRIVELERAQRRLVQEAYGATVNALAEALDAKDTGTRAHSNRVARYALDLTRAVEPTLADDVSVEYGFVLHDVGKIGVDDRILQKTGPLTPEERRVMEEHPMLGFEMLRDVTFLSGEGLSVVRNHHERWDGAGYPDRLEGTDIPLAARIFAVADTLDAMTSDRPYRTARAWEEARGEIFAQSGQQFDPRVVEVFREREPELRQIQRVVAAA